jgi:hypothetical protein
MLPFSDLRTLPLFAVWKSGGEEEPELVYKRSELEARTVTFQQIKTQKRFTDVALVAWPCFTVSGH